MISLPQNCRRWCLQHSYSPSFISEWYVFEQTVATCPALKYMVCCWEINHSWESRISEPVPELFKIWLDSRYLYQTTQPLTSACSKPGLCVLDTRLAWSQCLAMTSSITLASNKSGWYIGNTQWLKLQSKWWQSMSKLVNLSRRFGLGMPWSVRLVMTN